MVGVLVCCVKVSLIRLVRLVLKLVYGTDAFFSNATTLRQPCPMPPTSYIERLLDILLADADVSLSDKWLGSLVRLQSIMEDASNTLHRTSAEAFDEPSSPYQLKMAKRRLEIWKTSIPEGIDARE
jgi:hypothetical protein